MYNVIFKFIKHRFICEPSGARRFHAQTLAPIRSMRLTTRPPSDDGGTAGYSNGPQREALAGSMACHRLDKIIICPALRLTHGQGERVGREDPTIRPANVQRQAPSLRIVTEPIKHSARTVADAYHGVRAC